MRNGGGSDMDLKACQRDCLLGTLSGLLLPLLYPLIRDGRFKARFLQKRLEKRASEMGAYVQAFMGMLGWMLAFHPVTWNLLLAVIPDIAQAMQVPAAAWMSVMSQSSTNTAIVIWCAAAAAYEGKHRAGGLPA